MPFPQQDVHVRSIDVPLLQPAVVGGDRGLPRSPEEWPTPVDRAA